MKLTHDEVEFLSAWAREEWEPACYGLPAHRHQLAHGVSGAQLIALIKAWTDGEGKKDQEILVASVNPRPHWPWATTGEFANRLAEASKRATHLDSIKTAQQLEVT
jgi:hypothetical protein